MDIYGKLWIAWETLWKHDGLLVESLVYCNGFGLIIRL